MIKIPLTQGYFALIDNEDFEKVSEHNWHVQIHPKYKTIYLGRFKTQKDAALAYNKAAIKYYGRYAKLNVF